MREENYNNNPTNENDTNINNLNSENENKLKSLYEILSKGKIIFLEAFDNNKEPHKNILAFARQTEEQTGIFVL